ncbi:SAGA-associated factor 29 [Dirofilaria immitis]|nr:SAGA-associated factor 29 [Dirofilaria immitis]
MNSHLKYVSNNARSSQKLTLIEYNAEERAFKALQLRNACEMKMGIRRRNSHYFFVEEVVWMVETGLAVVLHRGMQLSVQECYRLLGTFLVTPEKFFVYSYLKRAGYVIVPYKAFGISVNDENNKRWEHRSKSSFPVNLLDHFPTVESMKLTVTNFRQNPKLIKVFGIPEDFPTSNIESINWDRHNDGRRNFKEFLRPHYWPRFDQFSSRVPTWSDYRKERAKILKRNLADDISDSIHLPIDYDIYVGDSTFCRNLSPKPIYRLLIVDIRFPFPSVSDLHWLSSKIHDGRLLIAVVQQPAVIFYNIDHQTQSGLKENIQLSEETIECKLFSLCKLITFGCNRKFSPFASCSSDIISVVDLCGITAKGVSHRSLVDAITRYSGKLNKRMRRSKRRRNSELDKDEQKLQIALQDVHKKMKSVIPLKKKVNESLSALQELVDKNKLSIGCKLNGSLRGRLEKRARRKPLALGNCLRISRKYEKKYELQRGNLVGRGELMQMLSQNARTAPLWIGPPDTHPPALVAAISAPVSMSLKVGMEVAAFIDGIWMLAEVTSVFAASKYEVKDIDDEQRAKYIVRRSRMIPLPRWRADPMRDRHALFPVGAIVLALYPQTTCFYKGVIDQLPITAVDDYLVAFEDSAFPQGYSPPLPVPQRYVLTHKVPKNKIHMLKKWYLDDVSRRNTSECRNTVPIVLREFDHDDEGAILMSASSTKIRRRKIKATKNEQEKKPRWCASTSIKEVATDEECHLPALKEDFPAYLGHAGLRLATFTKLLSHFSAMLIRDFGVPESKRKKAKEVKAKIQKEEQLRKGENIISLVSSRDIKANLDVQVAEIDTDDLEVVEERTKLSKDAFSVASFSLLRIPMNIEIIMVILYLGCLLSGANWILLSDVTRWFREGRFPVSLFQSAALLVGGKGNDIFNAKGLSFTMPLYEYMRTVMVVAQLTDIPMQPVPCSFERILVRLSYNLNLPMDFMQRLHTIFVISSPNVVFDEQFTHRFSNVDSKALLQRMNNAFCDNITFALEQSTYQLEEGCGRQYSVMPSVDVKAVAIILFALKLMFGLDEDTEFNMKRRIDAVYNNEEQFSFGVWMHQIKMRMNVWRGRRLKDVLEKGIISVFVEILIRVVSLFSGISHKGKFMSDITSLYFPRKYSHFRTTVLPKYDFIFENYRMVLVRENYRGERISQIRTGRLTGGRNLYFRGCIPNNFIMEKRDYALFSTFEDDFDSVPSQNLNKEALLTPLRYQATHHLEWYETLEKSTSADDLKKLTSKYNADVFFKSFKNYRMEYEVVEASGNTKMVRSEDSNCSESIRMKWHQLFPCCEHYESYPRPTYCPGLLKFTSGELIYTPMIYTPDSVNNILAVDVIYQSASPYFSESFNDLLEILSLMIGEDMKIVYTFFLMLEMKCLIPDTLNDLNEITKDCERFTTCAQVELLDDGPRNVEVQMCRINENVSRADFRFLVIHIGSIPIDVEKTSRTPVKRRRQKSCDIYILEKRSKEQRRQLRTVEDSMGQTSGNDVEEEENIFTRVHNKELANDFERMKLHSNGKQIPPPGRKSTSSRSMSSDDVNTILSLSDDEVDGMTPSRKQRYRKQDRLSEFSKTNIFKRSLMGKIKNRFSEYFNFEFESAFALAIPKYW